MAKVTINGATYEVPEGATIIVEEDGATHMEISSGPTLVKQFGAGSISMVGSNLTVGPTRELKVDVTGVLISLVVKKGNVTVTGDVGKVDAGGNVSCGHVAGDVDAGGNVECRSVKEVDAGGNVTCNDVSGNVDAGGSVRCGNIGGNADAGGNIRRAK